MNRRVLSMTLLLLWVFLIAFSIVKIFFPHEFIAVIDNEKILQIGNYIDSNPLANFIASTVISLFAMQFYLCACKQEWSLRWKQYIMLSGYTFCLNLFYMKNPKIASIFDLIGFIIIPLLMHVGIKQVLSVFTLHQIGQILTVFIRSEQLYLISTNYATKFIFVADSYIWLILYYIYLNLYKEKTLWEWLGYPFSEIKRKRSLKKNSKE